MLLFSKPGQEKKGLYYGPFIVTLTIVTSPLPIANHLSFLFSRLFSSHRT